MISISSYAEMMSLLPLDISSKQPAELFAASDKIVTFTAGSGPSATALWLTESPELAAQLTWSGLISAEAVSWRAQAEHVLGVPPGLSLPALAAQLLTAGASSSPSIARSWTWHCRASWRALTQRVRDSWRLLRARPPVDSVVAGQAMNALISRNAALAGLFTRVAQDLYPGRSLFSFTDAELAHINAETGRFAGLVARSLGGAPLTWGGQIAPADKSDYRPGNYI